ncbi:MAG: 4Fe-4S binding protein [Gammaproteobacteria bacterium]
MPPPAALVPFGFQPCQRLGRVNLVRITLLLLLVALAEYAWPASPTPGADSRTQRIQSLAAEFFPGADRIGPFEGSPPAAAVFQAARWLGYVFLTDQVLPIPAYSGKPISTLVGLTSDATIAGLAIVHHEEPILVIGLSDQDLARYIAQYQGQHIGKPIKIGGPEREGYVTVEGITGATITVMVLNASITRAAKLVAASRGLPLASESSPSAPARGAAPAATSGLPTTAIEDISSEPPPWIAVWQQRTYRIAALVSGLMVLATVLVLQDWLARHPSLLLRVRDAFLVYTLVFIGWYGLAQLSVINVFTFTRAVVHDFHWDTFLIDPMLFILWSFVALTLLLWGRGVYCGWLCPFGALQELVNRVSRRLGVKQLEFPPVVHERLLAVKYILLVLLFGLSLHSVATMVRFAEVEPFKTAINMHFQREWMFLLYASALVVVSAFNGKFYCKYLCVLGAALTFPSRFRIFDWLRRRRECGRPCQTCATECPSQAIRATGEINPTECHYCLDCQVTYWNAYKCPPLVEKRKRLERRGQPLKLRVGKLD